MGKIEYNVDHFASAIVYAQRFNTNATFVKAQTEGILRNMIYPEGLNLSVEIAQIREQLNNYSTRANEIVASLNSIREQIEAMDTNASTQITYMINNNAEYIYTSDYSNDYLYNNDVMYGADQGDPLMQFLTAIYWDNYYGYDEIYTKQYLDIVRKYFPDYGIEDTFDIVLALNQTGCGFAAISNYIYENYSGKSEEFKETFGFDMYYETENGKHTHLSLLELELFCYALSEGINDHPLKGRINKGHKQTIENLNNTKKTYVKQYGLDGMNNNVTIAKYAMGLSTYEMDEILEKYPNIEHIDIENSWTGYLLSGAAKRKFNEDSISEIKMEANKENTILLSASDYTLYNPKTNETTVIVDGGHWMTITDVTDDNKYVVSSWGKEYILEPDSLDKHARYSFVDDKD